MSGPGVLIIGAGMAGLTAAHELGAGGVESVLLDKGYKPGGRMATRRSGDARFDHGAQHFGVRDPGFRRVADDWITAGIVREWYRAGASHPGDPPNVRYAGLGGMRRIPEYLAADRDVRTGTEIVRLEVSPSGVTAVAADGPVASGMAVVITAPVPQTLALLAASALAVPVDLGSVLAGIGYHSCLAVMATLDGPAGLPDGHLTPDAGPIAWMGDNEHKAVSPVPAVTIHSTAQFAASHLEADVDEWVARLVDAAAPALASSIVEAIGHRWRFAEPQTTLDIGSAGFRSGVPIVLAGEVFARARVEGAFLSGLDAARRLGEML